MNNSTSKDLTEDFWNDCMNSESPIPLEIIVPYKNFSKTLGKNNNKDKVQNKSKYLLNLYSFKYPNHNSQKKNNGKSSKEKLKHKTIENSTFIKIYQNHPMLHENNLHSQEEKNLKKKKKIYISKVITAYWNNLVIHPKRMNIYLIKNIRN